MWAPAPARQPPFAPQIPAAPPPTMITSNVSSSKTSGTAIVNSGMLTRRFMSTLDLGGSGFGRCNNVDSFPAQVESHRHVYYGAGVRMNNENMERKKQRNYTLLGLIYIDSRQTETELLSLR